MEGWWAEDGKYNVLPLDDRFSERLLGREEDIRERAKILHFLPWCSKDIPERSAPHTKNRSHSITVEVEIPVEKVQKAQYV